MKVDQEEAEAIQAYDEAKSSNEEPIPIEQAFKEIEGKVADDE